MSESRTVRGFFKCDRCGVEEAHREGEAVPECCTCYCSGKMRPRPAPPKRVYLSGPMTDLPDFNFPAFEAAATRFRALGFQVETPHERFGGRQDLPRATYMRGDIKDLLRPDLSAVIVLPGWEHSTGARLEVAIAQEIGLPVLTYDLRPMTWRVWAVVQGPSMNAERKGD